MRYTWDGFRTFVKPATVATHALDYGLDPRKIKVLADGQLVPAEDWEIEDILMHMRDQAPPC